VRLFIKRIVWACGGGSEGIDSGLVGGQPETTTVAKAKRSFNWWGFGLWPAVVVMLYLLSFGPVVRFLDGKPKRWTPDPRIIDMFYTPWFWAYLETPLHKPLGMYMHLWMPNDFDRNGNLATEFL
jgi:hypothetical protein